MKKFKKILFWVFVVCIVSFVGLSVFVGFNGKRIAEVTLRQAFNEPVHIGKMKILFPLGLRVEGLEVENTLQAKTIHVQFGVPLFWDNQLVISTLRLIEPVVIIKRKRDKSIVLGQGAGQKTTSRSSADARKRSSGGKSSSSRSGAETEEQGVFINHIHLKDGKVQFSDMASTKKFQMTVEELNLNARSVAYPLRSVDTQFDMQAKIFSRNIPFSGSRAEARGWVNVVEKNMEGSLKVIEPDGRLGLSADLKSVHNDMTVEGTVNLGRSASGRSDASQAFSIEDLVFGALESTGVAMKMDFAFKTKMDDFQIGSLKVAGDVGHQGTPKDVGEGIVTDFKKIGEQFEDFGKKFFKKNIEPLTR